MFSIPSFLRRRRDFFIFGLILITIWLPRGLQLDRFVTTDEPLWLTRSANFYYALSLGDLASTYQKEHPGVTIMWAGAAAFKLRFPEYSQSERGQVTKDEFHAYLQRKTDVVTPLELLADGRAVVVLAHTLALGLSFLYALRLFGLLPAVLAILLVAFDPFHLALTRLLHLDGLMSNLVLLSLLAYLGYRERGHRLDLLVSGLAAGLGWLTKTPALFLVPVVGLFTLADLWRHPIQRGAAPALGQLWQRLQPAALWFAIGALVFVALWPAMWVHPIATLSNLFGGAERFVEEGHNSPLFFNGQVIQNGNIDLRYFYFYPLTYLWRSTPVVLVGLALAAWGYFGRREPFQRPGARLAAAGLVILIVLFLAGFTLAAKKFDRYLLPVYAPLDILAGLGWYSLAAFVWSRRPAGMLRYSLVLLALLAVGLQGYLSLRTFPYYLDYYNPLLGGSRSAAQVMHVGWGEGLDQAARYLNQKPGAAKLTTISWSSTGCLSYFFKGKDRAFWFDAGNEKDQWAQFNKSDYAVIYINQQQAHLAQPVLDYVAQLKPEHTVWLNGIPYAQIYKIH